MNFIFHLIYKFINGFLPKVFFVEDFFSQKNGKKENSWEQNYTLMTSTSSAQKNLIRGRKQSETKTEKKEKVKRQTNLKEVETESMKTSKEESKTVYKKIINKF